MADLKAMYKACEGQLKPGMKAVLMENCIRLKSKTSFGNPYYVDVFEDGYMDVPACCYSGVKMSMLFLKQADPEMLKIVADIRSIQKGA